MIRNAKAKAFQTSALLLALPLLTGALAGCAAGPDYHHPVASATAQAPFAATTAGVTTPDRPADRWWTLYHDARLDALVDAALAANTDLRVAVARLQAARARLHGAGADRLPQTDLSAGATYGSASLAETLPGVNREGATYTGGLALSYEVDAFGRVSRNIEAARADYGAAEADRNAVRLAVIADTVRAYFDVTTSSEQLAVAKNTVALLDHSLAITRARFDVGRADRIDVARIASLRDEQAAEVPNLEANRQAALLRLATLIGRAPGDLGNAPLADAASAVSTPALAQPIPVGDGRQLLAHRPDVAAAERRLAAASARIGVATADLYPHISLGASGGVTAVDGMNVLGSGAARWLVGPTISWAFPNQKAIRARINSARADDAAALATFDGTVLTALEETERALNAYAKALARADALAQARDAAATAARISQARQREGRIDFLTVLDAERTLASADAELVAARRAVALAQVDVFRALGTGWS